jgi:hypothetical protein
VKINVALFEDYAFALTNLLKEFKDVFAWTYKDLKGIPLKLHSIVVNLIFQYHWLNPNYVDVVKQDIDKLLVAGFIQPMEEVCWLSVIVVVPKKNDQLQIYVNFQKLNALRNIRIFFHL